MRSITLFVPSEVELHSPVASVARRLALRRWRRDVMRVLDHNLGLIGMCGLIAYHRERRFLVRRRRLRRGYRLNCQQGACFKAYALQLATSPLSQRPTGPTA